MKGSRGIGCPSFKLVVLTALHLMPSAVFYAQTSEYVSVIHLSSPPFFLITVILVFALGILAGLAFSGRRKTPVRTDEQSAHRFVSIVNESPWGLHLYRLNGNKELEFVGANPAADRMLGIKHTELAGKTILEAFPGLKGTPVPDIYKKLAVKGGLWRTEQIDYNEGVIRGAFEVTAFQTAQGEMAAAFVDISERKRTEEALKESETRFRTLFETMTQAVVYQDAKGLVISANDEAIRILGLSMDQLLGKTSMDPRWKTIREDGSDLPGSEHPAMKALATGKEVRGEVMGIYVPEQASYRWVLINAVPLFRPGEDRPYQVYAVFTDITERRRMELALRDSEEKYRYITENTTDVLWVLNLARGCFTYVSPSVYRLRGVTADAAMKERLEDSLTPESVEKVLSMIPVRTRELEQGTVRVYLDQHQQKCADGRVIWIETATHYQYNDLGEVEVHGVSRDISDRMRAENALRESEEIFSQFLKHSPIYVFFKDEDIRAVRLSDNYEAMLGRPLTEVLGKTMDDLFPSELAKSMIADDKKVLASDQEIIVDEELNGRYYTTVKFPIHIPGGRSYLAGYTIDITDRKKAELALRESQALFAAFMDQIPGLVLIKDHDLRPIYVNRIFRERMPADQWMGKLPEECFAPDVAAEMRSRDEAALLAGFEQYEETWPSLSDRTHTYETRKFRIEREGDRPLLGALIIDITDRKQTELALKESQERFALVIEASEQGIWDWNVIKNEVYYSPYWKKQLGYEDDELGNDYGTWRDLLHPDDRERAESEVSAYLSRPTGRYITEFRMRHKNGKYIWIHNSASSLVDENGKVVRMFGMHSDITEIREKEMAVRESEQRLRALVENMPVVLFVLDAEGRFILSEGRQLSALGLKPGQVVGMSAIELYADYPALVADLKRALSGETFSSLSDVAGLTFDIWYNPVYNQEGRLVSLIGVANDVTDRRRAEREREMFVRQWETTFNAVQDWVCLLDSEQNIMLYNRSMGEAFRDEKEGLFGQNCWKLVHKTECHPEDCPFHKARQSRRRESMVMEMDGKNLEIVIDPIFNPEGGFAGAVHIVRDITERVEAEELIHRNALRLESLVMLSEYRAETPQQLLDYALSEALRLTESVYGYIYYYSEGKQQFILNSWSGDVMKDCRVVDPQSVYDLDRTGIWGEAVRQRKPIMLNDFEAPHSHKKGLPEGHAPLKRFLTLPVFYQGEIVAVIGVANKVKPYNNGDTEQLSLLMDGVWKIFLAMNARIMVEQANAELENRVRERTMELESANRELESFSYSVSHDLRSPLRAIDGFAIALLEDCGEELGEDARNFLARIRQNAQKMAQLIDDLLQLSRINRSDILRESVDLSGMALKIARELEEQAPDRKVRWDIEPDMMVQADARLMDILLTNLLSNAFKFTARKPEAFIRFYRENREGHDWFAVSDNGAGFDMAFSNKLFGVFQRLHREEEYPGTGIGLSIVERIVKRHGGAVRASGEKDKGAEFAFWIKS